jgi:hypothetical protein
LAWSFTCKCCRKLSVAPLLPVEFEPWFPPAFPAVMLLLLDEPLWSLLVPEVVDVMAALSVCHFHAGEHSSLLNNLTNTEIKEINECTHLYNDKPSYNNELLNNKQCYIFFKVKIVQFCNHFMLHVSFKYIILLINI